MGDNPFSAMCRSGRHRKIRRMLPRPGFRAADTMRAKHGGNAETETHGTPDFTHKILRPRAAGGVFLRAVQYAPGQTLSDRGSLRARRGTPVSSAVPQLKRRGTKYINAKTQKRGRAGRVRPGRVVSFGRPCGAFLRGGMALVLFCVFASFALYHFSNDNVGR